LMLLNNRCLHRLVLLICTLAAIALLTLSCAKKERGPDLHLDREIHGFLLGERKEVLFERAKSELSWRRMEGNAWDYRGELYYLQKGLDGSREIDHIRLSFLDGRLFEIIAYYRDTSSWKLEELKKELEERFGGTMKAPDGTVETADKTYRLPGSGMSVTLRRITKQTGTELYVQYLHNELHGRLIERKLEFESQRSQLIPDEGIRVSRQR
jgi:hypothetical protein